MPHPFAARRGAATLALTALALAVPAAPAIAQDDPLSHLGAVTDPVVAVLAPSPSPSPTPLLPVPEPLAPVVEPVARTVGEAVGDLVGEEEPVAGQGTRPQPVAGPAGRPAPAPAAPRTAPQVAPRSGAGSAPSSELADAGGLRTGSGTAAAPALGAAPLLAAAPSYALPGLPQPKAAPGSEIAVSRPARGPAAPAGLPALVVAVAAVAVAAAGAGHLAELRVRREAAAAR